MSRYLDGLKVVGLLLALTAPGHGQAGLPRASSVAVGADGSEELEIRLTVELPDGSPAVGAMVISTDSLSEQRRTFVADALGRVTLRDLFLSGVRLHLSAAGGRLQAVYVAPDSSARVLAAQPVVVRLAPAKRHTVSVRSRQQPVAGATVLVGGMAFVQQAVTNETGAAEVWVPGSSIVEHVSGWHPEQGSDGRHWKGSLVSGVSTELSLAPPAPHVVRILDETGQPVAGLMIRPESLLVRDDVVMLSGIDAVCAQTDERGEVRWSWLPAEGLTCVNIAVADPFWKLDECDDKQVSKGLTIVQVRKRRPIGGRVVVPEGVNPAGLLIGGFAFGPGSTGELPRARVRADGRFELLAPAGHGHVLGIADDEWASDLWSGVLLPLDDSPRPNVELAAYPATPVEILVTRGSSRVPISNAWINYSRDIDFSWLDEQGEIQECVAGTSGWLLTDAEGRARTGIGKGECRFRLATGSWGEERNIDVTSETPVQLDFHREWLTDRLLTVRPKRDSAPYQPSPQAKVLAWSKCTGARPILHAAQLHADGTIEVRCDEESLAVLLADPAQRLSGFVEAGADDYELDLTMRPDAQYSGNLVARADGRPLVGCRVQLVTVSSSQTVVESQVTGPLGEFAFSSVPIGVALRPEVIHPSVTPEYRLYGQLWFEPGERRAGQLLRASSSPGETTEDSRSIADRLLGAIANANSMGMYSIALLEGDDSSAVKKLSERLVDDDNEAVLPYLPVVVTATQSDGSTEWLARQGWTRPAAGELVVLLFATADGGPTAKCVLSAADIESAFQCGNEFLEAHRPPARSGREKLREGCIAAQESGRTVWLILGGPRCGPCFSLARWVNEHRPLLERDLVIVKLTDSVDADVMEIISEIGGNEYGIPFHVLMAPTGEVLMTSVNPLGNIGRPASIEGVRHFRKMLETAQRRISPEELTRLMESLIVNQ